MLLNYKLRPNFLSLRPNYRWLEDNHQRWCDNTLDFQTAPWSCKLNPSSVFSPVFPTGMIRHIQCEVGGESYSYCGKCAKWVLYPHYVVRSRSHRIIYEHVIFDELLKGTFVLFSALALLSRHERFIFFCWIIDTNTYALSF